ncbi:MAG: cytochrome c-type biogenesis protein CcmH [Mangrovicoccus sp.]|nr:cytochrome c-type biogenesis protein CcmH [Mangrovicoccus sp.]
MRAFLLCLGILLAPPALAVEPNEVLRDPAQEARARELSKGLRCLVCRNESIDESNADLAKDLRLLVRERITEGDSDEEVIDFVVDRYGEYVLLKPQATGSSLMLWVAGPAMLILAIGMGVAYQRRQNVKRESPVDGLDASEEARLKEILDQK